MFILLKTIYQESTPFYRLIRIGKKKLPSIKEHNRYWGVIEESTDDFQKIHAKLAAQQYTTITRGERKLLQCCPVGQGYYGIMESKQTTHLAYILELPSNPGEVQKTFNIDKEASFFLAVKNPTQNIPLQSSQVVLPPEIQNTIGVAKWILAIPMNILNYIGIEIVFIGESNDLVGEFGEVGQAFEQEEKREEPKVNTQQLFAELNLSKNESPIEPLLGRWK